MLSRAVASVFFEEHRPQKLPIHGLYAEVAHDSCLPCKRYCRAASHAAACRAAYRVPCKRTLTLSHDGCGWMGQCQQLLYVTYTGRPLLAALIGDRDGKFCHR